MGTQDNPAIKTAASCLAKKLDFHHLL